MKSTDPTLWRFSMPPDIVDETGAPSVTYLGFWKGGSDTGNATAQAAWQIRKITTAASITKTQYASGNEEFDKIWDNRASYTYAFLK